MRMHSQNILDSAQIQGQTLASVAEDAIEKHVVGVILNTRLPYILKTGESELNRKQPMGDINIITKNVWEIIFS